MSGQLGSPLLPAQPAASRFFKREYAEWFCALSLVVADLTALATSVVFAALLVDGLNWLSGRGDFGTIGIIKLTATTPELLIGGAGMLAYFSASGHYSQRLPFWTEIRHIISACACILVLCGCTDYFLHGAASRQILFVTWMLAPPGIMFARAHARKLLDIAGLWRITVLLIGEQSGLAAARILLTSEDALGYRIGATLAIDDLARANDLPRFQALLDTTRANRLILAVNPGSDAGAWAVRLLLRQRIPFSLVPRMENLPVFGYERVAFFRHDAMLLSYRNALAEPLPRFVKTMFDLVVASLVTLFFAPLMLVIAAFVRLDGGPVLFAQERVGANGALFKCLKFRTMAVDAAALLDKVLASDETARVQWETARKLTNDPRVTRVGRFLRATSLDELPQLFNVLRLEMSLVGPRPIMPDEIVRYGDDIGYYYEAKPGLTGLWQVSGRSDTTYTQRVHLDSWYVRNWTLWHDIAILAKTIPAVLLARGAR